MMNAFVKKVIGSIRSNLMLRTAPGAMVLTLINLGSPLDTFATQVPEDNVLLIYSLTVLTYDPENGEPIYSYERITDIAFDTQKESQLVFKVIPYGLSIGKVLVSQAPHEPVVTTKTGDWYSRELAKYTKESLLLMKGCHVLGNHYDPKLPYFSPVKIERLENLNSNLGTEINFFDDFLSQDGSGFQRSLAESLSKAQEELRDPHLTANDLYRKIGLIQADLVLIKNSPQLDSISFQSFDPKGLVSTAINNFSTQYQYFWNRFICFSATSHLNAGLKSLLKQASEMYFQKNQKFATVEAYQQYLEKEALDKKAALENSASSSRSSWSSWVSWTSFPGQASSAQSSTQTSELRREADSLLNSNRRASDDSQTWNIQQGSGQLPRARKKR